MEEQKKAIFLSLYAMVIADGIVSPKELETMYRIGLEAYHVSPDEISRWVVSSGSSFSVPNDLENKIKILYHIAEIAWADGKIDDTERELLCRYCKRLGFDPKNCKDIVDFLLKTVQQGISFEETYQTIIND